jgi:hypothetical protein
MGLSTHRFELHTIVEGDHDRVREDGPVRLEVSTNRLNVAKDFGALVPPEFPLVSVHSRHSGEIVQLLPIDAERVDLAIALTDLEGRESQQAMSRHESSSRPSSLGV